MKERVHVGTWDGAGSEARFRAMEDELWEERGDRPEALAVDTRWGTTCGYRWPGGGEPVLFLHGTAGTSASWVPYIPLLGGRDAYAFDTIGDVGRTRQTVEIREPADLAGWLDQSLAGLGLDRVHVVGVSYGGFLGLTLATHHPERVRSLALLDPGGIVPLRLFRFMAWGMAVMLASRLPGRPRRAAARALRMPLLDDPRVMRAVFFAQRHHRVRLLPTEPLSDEQLGAIDVPVLVLAGDRSEVNDARALVARAEALIPGVETELIPGAGHALVLSHLDLCAERLRDFQGRADQRSKRMAP